jgi:hypothetical protein
MLTRPTRRGQERVEHDLVELLVARDGADLRMTSATSAPIARDRPLSARAPGWIRSRRRYQQRFNQLEHADGSIEQTDDSVEDTDGSIAQTDSPKSRSTPNQESRAAQPERRRKTLLSIETVTAAVQTQAEGAPQQPRCRSTALAPIRCREWIRF